MFKFEVGAEVVITNNNECYVDDPKMVAEHIYDPYDAACYCMSSQPEDDDIGKVLARWEDNGQKIYYISMYEDYDCDTLSCYCYLMDEAGLKIHEEGIKVGDKVKVLKCGETFSSYADWIVKHIEDKTLIAHWAYGGNPRDESIGTVYDVICIAPHSKGCKDLAFIKAPGNSMYKCYLIAVSGLVKAKPEVKNNHEINF
jgi:hypothetical protein